jgi:hypothetical protein
VSLEENRLFEKCVVADVGSMDLLDEKVPYSFPLVQQENFSSLLHILLHCAPATVHFFVALKSHEEVSCS